MNKPQRGGNCINGALEASASSPFEPTQGGAPRNQMISITMWCSGDAGWNSRPAKLEEPWWTSKDFSWDPEKNHVLLRSESYSTRVRAKLKQISLTKMKRNCEQDESDLLVLYLPAKRNYNPIWRKIMWTLFHKQHLQWSKIMISAKKRGGGQIT